MSVGLLSWVRSVWGRGPIGARGERIAARYLKRRGYRVLARNAVMGGVAGPISAEADLVCVDPDGSTIVVVEVKTRAADGSRGIAPEAQINEHKKRQLRRIAARLVRANGWQGRGIRIDVVAVEIGAEVVVRHHVGAVGAGR